MKKILITLAILGISAGAFAGENHNDQTQPVAQQQKQTSKSVSDATAINAGVTGNNVTFTSPSDTSTTVRATTDSNSNQNISGTQTIKNTPSVSGPNLVSSNDTCMGSASGSANGPGFGISLGKTYTDSNCVMLKNSRELWNMGMKAAAMALMCTDSANREALELTGFECPQTTKIRHGNPAVQAVAQPMQEQFTDPIVRARLGLPALEATK